MNVDFLEPVSSRSTVQDRVYHQLRAALMSGHFDPGQVLTIGTLADRFRTSHMPVREALRRLTAENALVVVNNGSAQVPVVTLEGLDDLCLTRTALETLAVRLSTDRCSPADRARFRALVEGHAAAAVNRDLQRMLQLNQELHFAIYNACGSSVVVQFIQSLWLRFGPYMRMLSAHISPAIESGLYEPSRHHADLVDAMDARDGNAAAEAIRGDIETTQTLLRDLCQREIQS